VSKIRFTFYVIIFLLSLTFASSASAVYPVAGRRKSRFVGFVFSFLVMFGALVFVSPANAAITIRPALNLGLVGYWAMDEGYGNKAYDQSGYRNTGTASGSPTWVDGRLGKALDFDGTSDYVSIPSATYLQGNQNLTISLWFYYTNTVNYQKIITKSPSASNKDYELSVNGLTTSVGWESEVVDSGYGLDSASGVVSPNQWYHFAAVLNKTANVLTLYINGNQVAQDTTFGNNSAGTTQQIELGRRGYTNTLYLSGSIDEVRIYNRALSAGEITRLYNLTKPKILAPSMKGLVGYWSFEEGMGTKAGDMSGRGNNGTIYAYSPSTVATDNFNRSDVNPIGGNWTTITGWGNMKISSNTLTQSGASSTDNGAYWNANTFSTNQYSQAKASILATNNDMSLVVRVQTGVQTFYLANLGDWGGGSKVRFYKWVNTTGTNLKETVSASLSAGDTLRFEAVGTNPTTLNMYKNGVLLDSITDSTTELQTTGAPGLVMYYTDGAWDDWEGGDMLPSWVNGKRGKALSFDGVNDYVDAGDVADLTGDFTIGFWFNARSFDKATQQYNAFISKRETFTGLAWELFYMNPADGTEGVSFCWGNSCAGDIRFGVKPNTGVWNHMVLTRNGNNFSLYLNAGTPATGTSSVSLPANTDRVRIGTIGGDQLSTPTNFFDGKIDEVRIYNRALSATEVASLYQSSGRKTTINSSQNTQLTTGLVGLWSFNGPDISGSLALDRSGQGNNGTIIDAIPTIGKVGQALSFNAVSKDWVRIGNILPTSAYTKTAWVYANTTGGGTNIVSGFNGSCCATGTAFWVNGADFLAAGHDGSYSQVQENASNFPLNSWQFVGVAYDSNINGGTLTLYRNGSQVGSATSISPPTGGYVTIGMFGDIGGSEYNPWDGKIDEVRVYNRALSAAEVKRLYNMGK